MNLLQIKVGRLKLLGCSLKLLANVLCTLTRKRVVYKLISASYLEKKENKCLKNAHCSSDRSANDVRDFSQSP